MWLILLFACESDPGPGPFALAWSESEECVQADIPDVRPPSALTVELWLRGDPGVSPGTRPLVGWPGVFGLGEDSDQNLSFWAGAEPGAGTIDSILDGVLHHVAGTWDGDSVYLFVDGVVQSFADGVPATGPSSVLRIGCDDKAHSFSGLLDEVRISSIVRYEDDFEAPTARFEPDVSTLLLYHFDEGQGELAADAAQGLSAAVAGPDWVTFSLEGAE